ncbi:virulence family protein [Bacillus thermophilus]|uniref:Anti-sigma-W factor RsiW n=1 Tax=Siminovitchia thermophila TaxID=1245522 RepID=A0ABS2R190_9BACI|nr:zf-HC2 domain-containing protein [Siminovitchia thermophila]MBM7713396.1 virulence family protein [Siminovitchia thermophila]ONK21126.1 hypothetical protein BLX87_23750 [Bacillus sp. VT-16-64]
MKEIKCTIIQDVLPLYVDGVVSEDTKEMVDEHLQHCETCQKEYDSMKRELYIPAENKVSLFKKISKKWRKKKILISIASAVATAIVLFGVFAYVFYYETVIPYSENLVKIEKQNDHQLASRYYGESYASVNVTHPMKMEIEGENKNVSFIYYTKTIADSPSRELIKNGEDPNKEGYVFELPESKKVDAVYYVDFDAEKVTAGKETWDSILERAVLIWEK